MTIEEAIRHYEESERINMELAENSVSALAKNHNLDNAEKCRQMIEWPRELQERRKAPEIIYCKDCRWNDGVCYCEFHYRDVRPTDYCSWAERRTDGQTKN